jgi:hypothetical protein
MTIHEFPKDGQRLWLALEPEFRRGLLEGVSPEVADEVCSSLASVVRRVGDEANVRIPLVTKEQTEQALNKWLRSVLLRLLTDLAIREAKMIELRTERDRLLAQLRRQRPAD